MFGMRVSLGLVVSMFVCGCSGDLNDPAVDIAPPESQTEVYNGVQVTQGITGHPGFVKINIAGKGMCSGFMINGDYALTAAHCFGARGIYSIQVVGMDDNGQEFCIGKNVNTANPCAFWLAQVYVNPSYSGTAGGADMAVIDQGFGMWAPPYDNSSTWLRMLRTAPRVGDYYVTFGWGARSDEDTTYNQLLYGVAGQKISHVGQWAFSSLPLTPSMPRGCRGDSGGPVVRVPISDWIVSGMHASTPGRDGQCGESNDFSVENRMDANLTWLEGLIGACRTLTHTDTNGVTFSYARCWR